MTGDDVIHALTTLRASDPYAHHSLHDIWWPLRDVGSTGDVERLLWLLWERHEVENPADGRWRLPIRHETQLALGDVPEAWGAV